MQILMTGIFVFRMKEQLIRELVKSGKDAETLNKQYAEKIKHLERVSCSWYYCRKDREFVYLMCEIDLYHMLMQCNVSFTFVGEREGSIRAGWDPESANRPGVEQTPREDWETETAAVSGNHWEVSVTLVSRFICIIPWIRNCTHGWYKISFKIFQRIQKEDWIGKSKNVCHSQEAKRNGKNC